jgi:predicted lactoylglutathione lyase
MERALTFDVTTGEIMNLTRLVPMRNIEDFHRHARENGLSVPDLDDTFHGMTEFRIDDPDGNHLWIGQATGGAAGT